MTTKSTVETACKKAGMKPVMRSKVDGYGLYIADGFSENPHKAFQKFGVEKGDYPLGCFMTLWMLTKGEDKLEIASTMMFEALHDAVYTKDNRQKMRINSAIKEAALFISSRNERHKQNA